jgi:uncharacterized protein
MTTLGTAIAESVIVNYGRSEFLSRLSDPFWFQAFGSVMGMDWHSSGITTSVMGSLKRGLNPRAKELGIYVCGGRGSHSRATPAELLAFGERENREAESLVRTSKLTAKIDNNAVADGFQLYLHSFVVTTEGEWAVVQQGMNEASRTARRYHWHSANVRDFTSNPHSAIVGDSLGEIMNLVDAQAKPAQDAILSIVREDPDATLAECQKLVMPSHHEVRAENVDLKRLGAVLAVAYRREFHDFASLLLLENLGPRTLQSLALIAEVVHGAPTRFSDPARFSFAHGGKDRHPFPVPLKTYDETIGVLRRGLEHARLERSQKLEGFQRLDKFTRMVENKFAPRANFSDVVAHEFAISKSVGGRSVFDDARERREARQSVKRAAARGRQLDLFSTTKTPSERRDY